jgi:hypothetical protein
MVVRDPEPLPAPVSAQEEAIRIAERLTALVESRRAESSGPPPVTAPGAAPADAEQPPAHVGQVVGARHTGRLLGNLLLTRGFIVESELRYALARQATTGGPIGQILVDLGLITDRDLVELLAEQMRMQVIDLSRVQCDRALRNLVPKADARRLAALPLRRVDGQIDVAVADPTDEDAVAELMNRLGAPLRLFLATRADIDVAVDRIYG